MANIDRLFVAVALAWLVLGTLLGFYMGAAGDNRFLDAHVAMLLPGFVVLAIYGMLYRQWPALNAGVLPKIQFWTAAIGVLGQVVGAVQLATGGGIAIVAGGSALVIVGAVSMAWLFWTRAS